MTYWKSKVLPKISKFFDKGKKKGASEVCKTFDKSKEGLDKEIADKSTDLNPKVVEIYKSSTTFIAKKLLKEPNEETATANPDAVQGLLQDLAKADFPGAKVICDAGEKFGPARLPGPVVYLFQKASVFLVDEPLPEEPKVETRELNVEPSKPTEGEAAAKEPETLAPPSDASAGAGPETAQDKPTETSPPPPAEEKKEETKDDEGPSSSTPVPPAVIAEAVAPTPAATSFTPEEPAPAAADKAV